MGNDDVFKVIRTNFAKIERNDSNTAAANSGSLVIINSGSGDADIHFATGTTNYTIGIDNSDSDVFKISRGKNVGASDSFIIDGSSRISMGSSTVTSAKLALVSTTLGFLPPVMTSSQMNSISSPAAGLLVYNSTSGGWFGADSGAVWRRFDSIQSSN